MHRILLLFEFTVLREWSGARLSIKNRFLANIGILILRRSYFNKSLYWDGAQVNITIMVTYNVAWYNYWCS